MIEGDPHRVLEGMLIAGRPSVRRPATSTSAPSIRWPSPRSERPSTRRGPRRHRAQHPGQRHWTSTSWSRRRRRLCLRRGDRAHALHRGLSGHAHHAPALSRRRPGFGASRPSSTTWRPMPACPAFCSTGRIGLPSWAPNARAAPRSSPWPARSNDSGLVEIPMGMTLREMIFEIGGGCRDGKAFKAVQLGGPSGGCIPAICSIRGSTTRISGPPGRSWDRAA